MQPCTLLTDSVHEPVQIDNTQIKILAGYTILILCTTIYSGASINFLASRSQLILLDIIKRFVDKTPSRVNLERVTQSNHTFIQIGIF